MKVTCGFLVLATVLFFHSSAQALCAGGPNVSCVTSFSIGGEPLPGNGSEFATGTVSAHLAQGATTLYLVVEEHDAVGNSVFFCGSGGSSNGSGCTYPNVGSDPSVTFNFNGVNHGTTGITGYIKVYAYGSNDPGLTANTTVNPAPPAATPGSDPDGPCDCGYGGKPINFANGDTWITQRDYSIPGLGGGLSLERTWNSLWSLSLPVEQSGIFGDSWRSNFEERIQVLTGGVVKYWKGNGSKLFYSYNAGGYIMTAPADDRTTLSLDSGSGLWTVTQKDGTSRIFNSAGYLTSIVDRNGNTTSIVVDAANQNRIASVTDAGGRTLTFNYANANPRLCTSIADSVGTVATYNYDSSGRLTQVVYPDSSQFNFTYDSNNLILSVTDSLGATVESHTYDSQRRGLTSEQANGVNKVRLVYYPGDTTIRNSFNHAGDLYFATIAQRTYLFQADSNSYCATCGYLPGRVTYRSPSAYPAAYTDAKGNTTFVTYDSQGNLASKSLPDRGNGTNGGDFDIWTYTNNSFGEVLTVTDPLNHTTTNVYDTHGNLLTTTTPSPDGSTAGSTTSFTYDGHGQLTRITDPLSNQTNIAYYSTGLIHTITDAQTNVTTYVYDARGNRTSVTDAASNQTQFQYDSMNRLTKITYPDSSTVQFAYDNRGRRTSVTDQNSKVTQYAYDDADRLTSVTDASSHQTQYAYDTENNLTDIYDFATHHTHFDYISDHDVQKVTFPSGYFEQYDWDQNDNMLDKWDRKNQQITFHTDPQDRVGYRSDSANTIYYTYDAAGRMTQAQDNTGTYGFTYDNMDRLTQMSTSYAFLTARNFTVQYAYDAASNRVTLTDPESGTTHYSYDTLNRLTGLNDFQSHNFTFSYDALSRRTQLTRPNGVNTNYSYDNVSRLLSVLHQLGSTTLDGASYTYDSAGNRTAKTDQASNVPPAMGTTRFIS